MINKSYQINASVYVIVLVNSNIKNGISIINWFLIENSSMVEDQ
jgi:hypothetical protein